jgi:hypothetical protein
MPEKSISELVKVAIKGEYSIPEFQREFIWQPKQVGELADSLSRGYPVGCIVVWKSSTTEGKEQIFVVDGQQRITALCIIFGECPQWKEKDEWQVLDATYSPLLSVSFKGEVSFGRKRGESISLPLKDIYAKTTKDEVNTLISEVLDASKTPIHSQVRTVLYEKTMNIWQSKLNYKLPVVVIDIQDPMEVAEIYQRLNELGTKIRETDTQLAFIAVKNPGWVKSVFRGFINNLWEKTDGRWDLSPGLLLRCMTILDSSTPRVGNIKNPKEFWESGAKVSFEKVRKSIEDVIPRLERYGIKGIGEIPSDYTLIALFSFHARYSKEKGYDFGAVFRWFLSANVTSRYAGAPLQILTEDTISIMNNDSPRNALKVMEIPKDEIIKTLDEDMVGSFKRKSPAALILKTLLWEKGLDWRKGGKLSTYPPLEWHHIFPKKTLKNMGIEDEVINNVANMTLLSEEANKEFSEQPPWVYGADLIKDPVRLDSHMIPRSYSASFIQGKPLTNKDGISKFLTERLKIIGKETKQLLGI